MAGAAHPARRVPLPLPGLVRAAERVGGAAPCAVRTHHLHRAEETFDRLLDAMVGEADGGGGPDDDGDAQDFVMLTYDDVEH